MAPVTSDTITALLRAWKAGQSRALDDLIPIVYPELKRLVRRYHHAGPGDTLQTTAVVHEAYLRLLGTADVDWHDRAHFFAVSARIIRGLLVDAARARCSLKRGGWDGRPNTPADIDLDLVPEIGPARADEILAVHEALGRLTRLDPRQASVVELRFFVGLSVAETAEVLNVSPQTVMRDWRLAKAWMRREIDGGPLDSPD
jgi:RNA polymerase sigma factor (TIGR02999 family)